MHVHTDLGHCMLHGALGDAASALGDLGLRVHRSHWVARHAVERVVRSQGQTTCVLANGLRIPVSRRNRAAVLAWFGRDARALPLPAARQRRP